MSSLEPNEILVLCALRDGARRPAEIKRPGAAARNAALRTLEGAGLVEARKEGRAILLALTADGARVSADLVAPPAPAAPRSRAGSSEVVLGQILGALDALRQAVARIEARLDAQFAPVAPSPPRPAAVEQREVRGAILSALRELDARHRFGGLVPIPELRRALAPHGFAPTAVDGALEALEQDFVIDLNVAQAPTQVSESAAGILRPGRGLLYYVARRPES